MFKEKFLLIIGILTMALPNLGFSNFIEKIIFAIFGLIIIFFAYGMYFKKTKKVPVKRVRNIIKEKPIVSEAGTTEFKKEEVTGFSYVRKDNNAS